MIEIFEQEKKDGLADLISNSSIAYEVELRESKPFELDFTKFNNVDFSTASLNGVQPDLYYTESILVTVGWNLNDDILLKEELLKAKDTPKDKPFNKNHNQEDIIGHITSSRLLTSDYEEADENNFEHIATTSVIYKRWRDKDKQEEISQLIDEIKDNKWRVSMEAHFPKFDYGLITPEGKQLIIPRTAESSFLTKHLKIFGGSGYFQNNKVGRVLRNILFYGKGLVKKPGNPYSVFLNTEQKFFGATASLKEIKEWGMNETEKAEFERMKLELEKANTALANFQEEAIKKEKEVKDSVIVTKENEINSLKNTVASLQEDLKKVSTNLEDVTSKLTSTEAAKDEIIKEAKANKDELDKMKKDATCKFRKETLAKLVEASRVEVLAEKLKDYSDAQFDDFISTLSEFKPFEKKEDKKEEKTETKADLANATIDIEVNTALASNTNKVEDAKKNVNEIVNFMKTNIFRTYK